jgi:hypothetical protein
MCIKKKLATQSMPINFAVKIMYIIEIYIVPIRITILIKIESDLLTEFYNWTS